MANHPHHSDLSKSKTAQPDHPTRNQTGSRENSSTHGFVDFERGRLQRAAELRKNSLFFFSQEIKSRWGWFYIYIYNFIFEFWI